MAVSFGGPGRCNGRFSEAGFRGRAANGREGVTNGVRLLTHGELAWGDPLDVVPMPALRLRYVFPCLLLVLATGGCQRDGGGTAEEQAAEGPSAPIAQFGGERVWQGVLPCSDCLGIDTRLVLRQEGPRRQYRLEETYLGAAEPNRFERQGRWTETREGRDAAAATVFVLDPDRAPRRFRLEPDGGVELLVGAADAPPAPEYRLQRL
jgi:copper homeostasis protein (lipoprotein)